jgi:hypothetical protein
VKTERNARRNERPGDTIPEQAGVYVPPRPLASLADHRTMDVKAIRLAAEVDPRQALTELRLEAPPRRRAPKGWLIPVAFAVLAIGFIALWWATPGPLPLSATAAAPPPELAPGPPPITAEPAPVITPAPLEEPSSLSRDVGPRAPENSVTATPAPARPSTLATPARPSTLATPASPPRAAAPPSTTSTAPPSAAESSSAPDVSASPAASAPHRAKGSRDPWLD